MGSEHKVLINIGGTGARLLKPIPFLAAFGYFDNIQSIKSYAIDPDQSCGDYNDANGIIDSYEKIRKRLSGQKGNKNNVFEISIKKQIYPLIEKTKEKKSTEFTARKIFSVSAHEDEVVGKVLNSQLSKLLELPTNNGFRGKPNLGSLLFNHFSDKTNLYQALEDDCQEKDRDFYIMGSIFGGTGAAGIPVIAEKISELIKGKNQSSLNIFLGLPYFKYNKNTETDENKPEEGEDTYVRNVEFVTKAKVALDYYSKFGNYNNLFAIGYNPLRVVGNFSAGGTKQRNNPHLVELFSPYFIRRIPHDNNEGNNNQYFYTYKPTKNALNVFDDKDFQKNIIILLIISRYLLDNMTKWSKEGFELRNDITESPEIRDTIGKYFRKKTNMFGKTDYFDISGNDVINNLLEFFNRSINYFSEMDNVMTGVLEEDTSDAVRDKKHIIYKDETDLNKFLATSRFDSSGESLADAIFSHLKNISINKVNSIEQGTVLLLNEMYEIVSSKIKGGNND